MTVVSIYLFIKIVFLDFTFDILCELGYNQAVYNLRELSLDRKNWIK